MRDTLLVKLVRHGSVASHHGDIPVTAEGLEEAEEAGRRLSADLAPGTVVTFFHAQTRRTRETAAAMRWGMAAALAASDTPAIELRPPAENWALRNPDLYVAGQRVEMVSSAEAMAAQLPGLLPSAAELAALPFLRGFWGTPDRIGYWVAHPDPPGEDADAVARRLLHFAASLRDLPAGRPRLYVCVTHSPLLRAFLRRYVLDEDRGEPAWVESIDLEFAMDDTVRLSYRELRRTLNLSNRSTP